MGRAKSKRPVRALSSNPQDAQERHHPPDSAARISAILESALDAHAQKPHAAVLFADIRPTYWRNAEGLLQVEAKWDAESVSGLVNRGVDRNAIGLQVDAYGEILEAIRERQVTNKIAKELKENDLENIAQTMANLMAAKLYIEIIEADLPPWSRSSLKSRTWMEELDQETRHAHLHDSFGLDNVRIADQKDIMNEPNTNGIPDNVRLKTIVPPCFIATRQNNDISRQRNTRSRLAKDVAGYKPSSRSIIDHNHKPVNTQQPHSNVDTMPVPERNLTRLRMPTKRKSENIGNKDEDMDSFIKHPAIRD